MTGNAIMAEMLALSALKMEFDSHPRVPGLLHDSFNGLHKSLDAIPWDELSDFLGVPLTQSIPRPNEFYTQDEPPEECPPETDCFETRQLLKDLLRAKVTLLTAVSSDAGPADESVTAFSTSALDQIVDNVPGAALFPIFKVMQQNAATDTDSG